METLIEISYDGNKCGVNAWKEIDLQFTPSPLVSIAVAGGLNINNDVGRMTVCWSVEDERFIINWRPSPKLRPCDEAVAEQIAAFIDGGWTTKVWGVVPNVENAR